MRISTLRSCWSRIPRFAGPLYPLLLFTFSSLALLTLSRLLLILWQWPRVAAVEGLGSILLLGLRMDLQIVSYITAPLLLATFLLPTPWQGPVWRRVAAFWTAGWTGIFLFMECATPSFINQYDSRPNRIFLEYLVHPREVGLTLWADYKFQLLGALLLVTMAICLAWRLGRHAHAQAGGWGWMRRLILFPVCAGVLVLAARGSLDHRPANPSTAAFSSDHLVNDLAVSSTHTALYALYSMKHEEDAGRFYPSMPEDEIFRRVQRLSGIQPTHPAVPTLHRQVASRRQDQPMNLVIILEESLGAQYVGALGGKPYTPELDRLASEGLWFENLYATGTRSVRGIEAVVTGFLPTPGRSIVKLGLSQNNFFTLAELLDRAGYRTSFIYGGESHFDNMGAFFLGNGFEEIIDENDYPDPVFRGTWGVSDEDLFARAHQEFSKAQDPFFALVFTSSNHTPYEYPQGRIEAWEGEEMRVANAIRYADYALGRFFEQARASDYWENTLFLVVADHDDVVAGPDLVPIQHFRIPGLILGGGIAPARIDTLASQIDLGPTLLSLIGLDSEHPMPGIDLTTPPPGYKGRAIMQYGTTHALLRDGQVAIHQNSKPGELYDYRGGRLVPATEEDPELLRDALATALWPSLAYRKQQYRLNATPSPPPTQTTENPAALKRPVVPTPHG